MPNDYRCFLAIDLESVLIGKIEEIQKEFKQTTNNIKYVEKENLHFTLKFFGNINKNKINNITEATNKVLANIKTDTTNNPKETQLTLKGIGTFPNKNYMKILWIGTENNRFLNNLQKELDLEFEKLGFKMEKNFKTHLTIGRIRNLKNKKEFKSKIEELKNIKIGTMSISKISFKMSELTPTGPIYSNIKVFNFNS